MYKYVLVNNTLKNPKPFSSLAPSAEPDDNVIVIRSGTDKNVYIMTGEMDKSFENVRTRQGTQSMAPDPDVSNELLRFTL